MNNINKWYADKCGIELIEHFSEILYTSPMDDNVNDTWTISDPRCREIIREKFRITTMIACNVLYVSFLMPFDLIGIYENACFKTIEEAELALLQAIYEARDD